MKKILIGIGVIIVLGIVFFPTKRPTSLGVATNSAGEAVVLIGTQTGTTTAGVYFSNTAATTTYPFVIGSKTKEVSLKLSPTQASTTGSNISLNILASNDYDCGTATTTTIFNVPTVEQIHWYDAGYTYLREFAGSLTIPTASTTLSWSPTAGQGRVITLTDVNAKCLALAVHASSTTLYAEFVTK